VDTIVFIIWETLADTFALIIGNDTQRAYEAFSVDYRDNSLQTTQSGKVYFERMADRMETQPQKNRRVEFERLNHLTPLERHGCEWRAFYTQIVECKHRMMRHRCTFRRDQTEVLGHDYFLHQGSGKTVLIDRGIERLFEKFQQHGIVDIAQQCVFPNREDEVLSSEGGIRAENLMATEEKVLQPVTSNMEFVLGLLAAPGKKKFFNVPENDARTIFMQIQERTRRLDESIATVAQLPTGELPLEDSPFPLEPKPERG
jgi:hypothetical protein